MKKFLLLTIFAMSTTFTFGQDHDHPDRMGSHETSQGGAGSGGAKDRTDGAGRAERSGGQKTEEQKDAEAARNNTGYFGTKSNDGKVLGDTMKSGFGVPPAPSSPAPPPAQQHRDLSDGGHGKN
jgi:hypothetical protein